MKFNVKTFLAFTALSTALFSCQKQDKAPVNTASEIPADVINQIKAQGFSTDGIIVSNGGYVVEGDIFLSKEALNSTVSIGSILRVGDEEQYHTTNLIKNLPRTITISVQGLDAIWTQATDIAVSRYNALNMRLKFQRVSSGGNIVVTGADLGTGGILGQSSGFPTTAGNPATPITINNHPGTFGSNPSVNWLATIVAHEVGHTVGFRHTDYKNRTFSCGLTIPWNEGDAGVGAIWIPGTPTGPKDPGSWMLACTDGSNRPFNPNDIIALNFLYK